MQPSFEPLVRALRPQDQDPASLPKGRPALPILPSLTGKLQRGLARADHMWRRERHRMRLPSLTPLGRRMLRDLRIEGVVATSLDELGLASNASFWPQAMAAVEELRGLEPPLDRSALEYPMGFEHCIPLNPSRIARAYPAIYTWGLDERILDLVEAYIGTDVAYHGPILRKEICGGGQVGTRCWHQDGEDYDITRISIYLTDVMSPGDGAFQYIPRYFPVSPRDFKAFPIDDETMESVVPRTAWKSACGPAGTVLVKSTSRVYHRGMVPNTPRIVVSYYYTSTKPISPQLCRDFSFRTGLPHLRDVELSPRQLSCLWEYRSLLPVPKVRIPSSR